MPKQAIWILMIATGVFLGIFGYEQFTEYRLQKALEVETAKFQQVMDNAKLERKQRAAEVERKRQAEIYKNTACGINEDKNTCVCINEKTGAKIRVAHNDCVKRAREITW